MDAFLAETPDAAAARPRVLVLSGPAAPYDGLPVDLAEHGFDAYHETRIGDAVRKLAAIDPSVLVLVPATPGEAEEALRSVRAAPRAASTSASSSSAHRRCCDGTWSRSCATWPPGRSTTRAGRSCW